MPESVKTLEVLVPTIKLQEGTVVWAKVALPAAELLRAKVMLTIEEAAWVLGDISPRQVRYLVDAGLLDAGQYAPLRITSESVKDLIAASKL